MPKKISTGIVTGDKTSKTRRVEIPRLARHPKYGKYTQQKTICYVHDEENVSQQGDKVEIIECPPKSKTKRWQLVRVVQKNKTVNLAALRETRDQASAVEPISDA